MPRARKISHFETAAGGTIFLDEIGDLSLDLQINLLRFLQEHTIAQLHAQHDPHEQAAAVLAALFGESDFRSLAVDVPEPYATIGAWRN